MSHQSFLPSPTVEWWEVSWVFPLFLSLPEKCCSAPHQAHAGNMRHSLNTQWDFLLLSTGAFEVHTVCLHPAQSQRPALSHQPSVVMNGLSPYRLRAAGAVWRTGQLNRWSPSASDPADNRSKWAYHYYYLMFHCIQITITKMARGTSRQVQLSSTWTVRLTQERL